MHQGEGKERRGLPEMHPENLRDVGPAIAQIADGARRDPFWVEDCRQYFDKQTWDYTGVVTALVSAVNVYALADN